MPASVCQSPRASSQDMFSALLMCQSVAGSLLWPAALKAGRGGCSSLFLLMKARAGSGMWCHRQARFAAPPADSLWIPWRWPCPSPSLSLSPVMESGWGGGMQVRKLYVQLLCPLQVFPEGGADITILLCYGFPPARSWEDAGRGRMGAQGRGWGWPFRLSPAGSSSFCD